MQFLHLRIARGFGEDGSGGDGGDFPVALDNGSHGHGEFGAAIAVDYGGDGRYRQGGDGALHGEEAGLQDVDFVDFRRAGFRDRPGQRLFADERCQLFAATGGELFGVVQSGDGFVRVKDDGSGNHRTRQRSAPGFVDTANTGRERF